MSDDFETKLNKIVWRRPAPKNKQRKVLSKKVLFIGGIFLVILMIIGGLFFSPIFKVKEVIISGDDSRSMAVESFVRLYINHGAFLTGDNILFFDSATLAEKIKAEFPIMEETRIKMDFLKRTMLIELVEKKSIGIWCVDSVGDKTSSAPADMLAYQISNEAKFNRCFYLDKKGVILEEAPQVEGSLIFLIKTQGISAIPAPGAKVVEEDLLDFMLKIKEDLFSKINIGVKEFSVKFGSFDAEALTTEGFKIFFDGKKNPDKQIANLKIMLEEKIGTERANLEYIDLREGNRIYYKFKGDE